MPFEKFEEERNFSNDILPPSSFGSGTPDDLAAEVLPEGAVLRQHRYHEGSS